MYSVNCSFDEEIPDRGEEHFEEMRKMYVEQDRQKNNYQENYEYLVNSRHVDDENNLEYVVTRIGAVRKDIVAWRAPWLDGRIGREEPASIHVADVVKMLISTIGMRERRRAGPLSEGVSSGELETGDKGVVPTALKSRNSKYRGMSNTGSATQVETSRGSALSVDEEKGNRVSSSSDATGVGIASERPGKRIRRPNVVTNVSEFGDIGYAAAVEEVDSQEENEAPTVHEALRGPQTEEWQESIQNENESLRKRNVFSVLDLPVGRKALKSKYILKIKSMADGRKKYKARLVVLGCNQREGIDYLETFAPVAKGGTIRLLLALAQLLKLHVHQMDVDTAFLYAPLLEEIYMRAPEGMGGFRDGQVLKLNKSLYGL
jgi:hypothetical protein